MADTHNTVTIDLETNAQRAGMEVNKFAESLGRVNQQARRIFASLQELSQRYQQHGFLGQADQRVLERGLQQWERMAQVIDLRRQGAVALNRPRTAANLAMHQQALGTLYAGLGNITAGGIPFNPAGVPPSSGPYSVWPYGGGRATGGRFYGPGFGPGSMAGYPGWRTILNDPSYRPRFYGPGFGPYDMRGYREIRDFYGPGFGPTSMAGYHPVPDPSYRPRFYGPGFGPTSMAGYHPVPDPSYRPRFYGPGFGPYDMRGYEGPEGRSSGGRFYGPGFGPGSMAGYPGWRSAVAPGGGGPGFGAHLGSAAMGVGGWLARTSGGLAGLAIGYTGYQLLNQGMQTFETRARGVLAIGGQLGGQYRDLDTTLKTLRSDYYVLAREGVAAMAILSRASRFQPGALAPNVVTGLAYGMEPESVARWQAEMTMAGIPGTPNLQAITGIANQAYARGLTRFTAPRFAEETARLANEGGLGFAPLTGEQYGRMTAFQGFFGPRFAQHAAQAHAEYIGGLGAPASPLFETMRWQALADLASRKPIIEYGGRLLNIRSNVEDQRIAIENAGEIADVQDAYYSFIRRQGGGETWGRMLTGGMFGARRAYTRAQLYEGLGLAAGQRGGILGQLTEGTPPGEATNVATILAGQAQDPTAAAGLAMRRQAAQQELIGDTKLVESLQNARNQITDAFGTFAEQMQRGAGFTKALADGLERMNPQLLAWGSAAATLMGGLAAVVPGGQLVAVPLLIGGATGAAGSLIREHNLGQTPPTSLVPMSTQPRKALP